MSENDTNIDKNKVEIVAHAAAKIAVGFLVKLFHLTQSNI